MKNIIIIGGGASGITCALKLKQNNPNYNIIILEKNDRIGKKILKTGNGKCNISNLDINEKYYNDKKFIKSVFQKVSLEEVITFFEKMGLFIKQDDSSTRLYPYSETATSVLEIFLYELNRLKIDVRCNHYVTNIKKNRVGFSIETNQGNFSCNTLVVACGSMAQDKTNGYQLLENLDHSITKLRPGLVPLKTKESLKSIEGIRIKCLASIFNKNIMMHQEKGEILFKDKGLSGVLTLNLSRYYNSYTTVSLDLFPNRNQIKNELVELANSKGNNDALLGVLPKMLAYEIIKKGNNHIDEIIRIIRDLQFEIIDTYGFEQAQITIGGVTINQVNENFSSKIIDDLYIIGEVLDIDGASGGYNLHFAWVSGIVCANTISSI